MQLWRAHVQTPSQRLRLSYVLTTGERYRAILANHLPPSAVGWVYAYLDRHKVHFHITRGRRSKYGDYRWPQRDHNFHEMSVNGDLPPLFFLWVFLHEAAHLETHLKCAAAAPHGHEWQAEYARLMVECLGFFPSEIQPAIRRLASHIPLGRSQMRQVEQRLRGDADPSAVHLDDLPAGSLFRLKSNPDMQMQSLVRRRTRWLCRDVHSGRQYTVSISAEVIHEG